MRFLLALMSVLILDIHSAQAQQTRQMDWQGHRGYRGLYPENTIQGMIEALKLGVTTLELDVVITQDRQVVLSHEPFMSHEISTTPDGKHLSEENEKQFNIYQMNYEELKRWDVGLKSHPRFPNQIKMAAYKPLLSELIDTVEQYIKKNQLKPVYYNIETKSNPEGDNVFHPEPSAFVDLLWEVIKKKKIQNRVIIQSFDKRTIKYIHQQKLPLQTAYLLEDSDAETVLKQLKELGFKPDIISPEFSRIDQKYVSLCHHKGIKVIPWTVNNKNQIARLLEIGVDGIISDYPNLFPLKK